MKGRLGTTGLESGDLRVTVTITSGGWTLYVAAWDIFND